MTDEQPPPADPGEQPTGFPGWWGTHMRWLSSRRTSVVLAVLVIALGAVLVVREIQANQQRATADAERDRFAECLATYADELAEAIDNRAAASNAATDAQDALWTAIAANFTAGGGDAIRDAVFHYRDVRAATRKAQRENPYPPPPKLTCR